jgi:hypothetical protein
MDKNKIIAANQTWNWMEYKTTYDKTFMKFKKKLKKVN